jgi:lysophospholipase L1-like esterase
MKNILCYGDSNTWGFNAETKGRFHADVRWTGVLKNVLGEEYHVIEEGLNGRTTVWDDPIEDYRNGKEYLIPCLRSHRPLDLVIIMLGTNDLKKRFSLTAIDIAAGAGVLIDIVLKSDAGYNGKAPKMLLIAPISVGKNINQSEFGETFDGENSVITAQKFANYYKRLSEQKSCEFMDAAEIASPSPIDAIHFEAGEHKKLGEAVAQKVRVILE